MFAISYHKAVLMLKLIHKLIRLLNAQLVQMDILYSDRFVFQQIIALSLEL